MKTRVISKILEADATVYYQVQKYVWVDDYAKEWVDVREGCYFNQQDPLNALLKAQTHAFKLAEFKELVHGEYGK